MPTRVYLDAAAALPPRPASLRAFLRAQSRYGNPSAPHTEGRNARALLEEARATIAHMAGAKPDALVFTSNATEANALAIEGYVRALQKQGIENSQMHLLYMEGAHASVHETMQALLKDGIAVDTIPYHEGALDLKALSARIQPETVLVSLEVVSSETGLRTDTKAIRHLLDAARTEGGRRIVTHVDACQLPLTESFEWTRLGADLLTLDAQKVGGIRGIGCLIHAASVQLTPLIHGGGQEGGLRSGTETPAHAHAFAVALTEAQKERARFVLRAEKMRSWLKTNLTKVSPDIVINEGKENVPQIVNISCLNRDTDYLLALLDEKGYAVSTKSACESDSAEGSRSVRALTKSDARASSTLRISFTPKTSFREVRRFFSAFTDAITFIDRTAF